MLTLDKSWFVHLMIQLIDSLLDPFPSKHMLFKHQTLLAQQEDIHVSDYQSAFFLALIIEINASDFKQVHGFYSCR